VVVVVFLVFVKRLESVVYNKLPTIVTIDYQFHTFQCACVNLVFVQLNGHYNSTYVHDRPVVIFFFSLKFGWLPSWMSVHMSEKLHLLWNIKFLREYDFIFLFDGPSGYYNIGSAGSELTTIVTLAALAQIM
jgi:hypothetical protein